MSWNFSGSGNNGAETAGDFLQKLHECPHIPDKMRPLIAMTAGTLAGNFPHESVKTIGTHGHVNEDGTGNVSVRINC